MKTLVVYSSLTGNTEKVARAIAEVMPNCDIHSVQEAPEATSYDMVAVGFWVDKGMPDKKAFDYINSISNANVALFGTLGAWADSEHSMDCAKKGEDAVKTDGKNNNYLGAFICQGKVDPKLIERMQSMPEVQKRHPMTEERKARIAEAAKHPDENDLKNAQEAFKSFINKMKG